MANLQDPNELPARLGPCRLIRPLGAGTTGIVLEAVLERDRSYAPAGTRVAVKLLRLDLVRAASSLESLQREAELGRRIAHDVVARVHELGSEKLDGEQRVFLVSELVEGRTLRATLDRARQLPEPLLRHLALQLAGGLAAIHEAGVVHRDVKPENVLLTADHEVKLVDLGLAGMVAEAGSDGSLRGFVGSPLYAAPEQFDGREAGPAADRYSLGILLHEAAAGAPPFSGEDLAALRRAQLEESPPPLEACCPELSPFMAELLRTLLEKTPERRFEDSEELVSALAEGEASPWWRERDVAGRSVSRRLLRGPDLPLVGRESELGELHRLVNEARAGRGGVVVVEGEAGLGKSRLLRALAESLERDGEALLLLGDQRNGLSSSGAFTQSLCEAFGRSGLADRLRELLPEATNLASALTAHLSGTASSGQGLSLEVLSTAFARLVEAMTDERPLVWMIEDLHRAGEQDLAVLRAIAQVAAGRRLLVVATTRAAGTGGGEAAPHRIRLEALEAGSAASLLDELGWSAALPVERREELLSRAAGHPLALLEMLRAMRQAENERRLGASGGEATVQEPEPIARPDSVSELLLSRLAELGPRRRELLLAASVQGPRFDPELLALSLDRPALGLLEALGELEERFGILRAIGAAFEFQHQLLHEVALDSLSASRRKELHARLAGAFARRAGLATLEPASVPGADAAFWCRHALLGGELPVPEALIDRAFAHLSDVYAHRATLELSELALGRLGEERPELRCDVLVRRANCLDVLGRRDEGREAVTDAVSAAETSGDPARRARARLAAGVLELHDGDAAAAAELLQQVLVDARAADDQRVEAEASGALGLVLRRLGRMDEAEGHLSRELELSRSIGWRAGEAHSLNYLAMHAHDSCRLAEARELGGRAVAILATVGPLMGEAAALGNLSLTCAKLGLVEEAVEKQERALGLYREIGYEQGEAVGCGILGGLEEWRGELARARELFERQHGLIRRRGDKRLLAYALHALAALSVAEGRLDEGRALAERCLRLAREVGDRAVELRALLCLLDEARGRDDATAGEAIASQASALSDPPPPGVDRGSAAFRLARWQHEQGRRDEARALLQVAEKELGERPQASLGALPIAYLALLGDEDPDGIVVPDGGPAWVRAESHLTLHRAGAAGEHLARARELLGRLCDHLHGDEREAFWQGNPLARQLLAAGESADT